MPFSFPPVSVLLTWPTPNFTDPIKRGAENYVVGAVFFALSTIALAVRLYARLYIRRWFGLDDVMICVAYVAAIGVTTSVLIGVFDYGWDRHIWDLEPKKYRGASICFYTSALCWAVAASCVRFSLLCFYYRLTAHVRFRRYIWVLHVVSIVSVLFLLAYVFSLVFFCLPVSDFWMKPLQWNQLKCSNIPDVVFSMSVVNTCLEFIVALLPVPVLFNINMTSRQRWSIISILSLGILVTILGMIRCWFVWQALVTTYDATWWGGPHWTVSEVENNVSIICACAPALRPVLGRLFSSSPIETSRPSTGNSPLLPPAPTLKPKQYVDYPSANNRALIDLEGIADDGKGYTFFIMGDDESYIEELERGARSRNPFGRFLSRLMSWGWKTRMDPPVSELHEEIEQTRGREKFRPLKVDYQEKTPHETIRRWQMETDPEQLIRHEEEQEQVSPQKRHSWNGRFPPPEYRPNNQPIMRTRMPHEIDTDLRDPSMEALPSPDTTLSSRTIFPGSPAGETAASSDYLSWSKRTDPMKRWSPYNPVNSSHTSSPVPRPDRRDRGRLP